MRYQSRIIMVFIIFISFNFLFYLYHSGKKIFIHYKLNSFILTERKDDIDCLSAFNKRLNLTQPDRVSDKKNNCNQIEWVDISDNGSFLHNKDILKASNIEIESCSYLNIKWKSNDFNYLLTEEIRVSDGDLVDKNESFFIVKCKSRKNQSYMSAFAKIFQKPKETKLNNPFNVLFIGFDSVSNNDFFENLPQSSYFLKNILKSNILWKYNIVGDGTPAALIPIFTSKHENELPNTIRGTSNVNYVDEVYPFIWKNFTHYLNYSTLFLEDWPHIGTFQYRMVGMKNPPTDYYMRQFLLGRKDLLIDKNCIGNKKNFKFYLDFIKEFVNAYHKTGFYGFSFIAEYSHDADKQFLKKIDSEFNYFLREFHTNKKIYGNTILVIFSDHGPRFSHLRKSVQGLLNERNPFFSIYLPNSFQNKYPIEFENFQSNSDKLVTPMDIHRTFMSLIDLETGKKEENIKKWFEKDQRSISLFDKINSSRTCEDAGISNHWCACLKRSQLDLNNKKNDYLIQLIGQFFVGYLNNEILKDHLNECENLKIKNFIKIFVLKTYLDTKKAKTQILKDKRLLSEPEIEKDFHKFFIQIETSPNNGIYEATIIGDFDLKQNSYEFKINKNEISRINQYGNDPHCIYNSFPDLRKYCFCKK